MGSQKVAMARASVEENRAYILDMVEQLARMAAAIGDNRTADALRQAVEGYVPASPIPPAKARHF